MFLTNAFPQYTFFCTKICSNNSRALRNLEKKEVYSSRCLDLIRILFDGDKNAVRSLLTAELPIPEKFLDENKLLNFANKSLAEDQKSAVEFALKRKYFAIIQGPPGTGKTTTLVELVVQLCRLGKKVFSNKSQSKISINK